MSEFADYLHEVFALFGDIQLRKMFGGYGVYRDGLMFGLIADDTLYLKADSHTIAEFENLGLPPFSYAKNGKTVKMSYYLAPDDIFEDKHLAARWANLAFAAALRGRK